MPSHRTLSKRFTRILFAWIAAALLVTQAVPHSAYAFTQSGLGTAIANGIPMGHEWITRRAAIELLLGANNDPVVPPDPNDPRRTWTRGLAKNLSLKGAEAEVARIKHLVSTDIRYQSLYRPIFDSIIGERWVDIGGFNIATSKMSGTDCWDAVAQEPAEIQEDHFMRRYDDAGGEGGVRAALEGQRRFIRYFVEAAIAPPTSMRVWDGGAEPALETVDRNYFLMGRAAHLFEDSFSSEHTVRIETATDNMERVRQVKSYLCAFGSEQHTHALEAIFDYSSGDVIWLPKSKKDGSGWPAYKPSNMKHEALVAMEATKDLWAAFIRTMAVPMEQRKAKAEAEAKTLVDHWLSFDTNEMLRWYDVQSNRREHYVFNPGESGTGQTQSACMKGLGVTSGRQSDRVAELQRTKNVCLWNVEAVEGYSDLFDPQIRMFYNWQRRGTWDWNVPPGWSGLERPADTGQRVRVSLFNPRRPMSAPLGNKEYVRLGGAPLDLIIVPNNSSGTRTEDNVFFRATFAPTLFLSYTATADGTVMLWNGTKNSSYKIGSADQARSIMNLYWQQYIWADEKGWVYLTKKGDPKNMNSQWWIEPAP